VPRPRHLDMRRRPNPAPATPGRGPDTSHSLAEGPAATKGIVFDGRRISAVASPETRRRGCKPLPVSSTAGGSPAAAIGGCRPTEAILSDAHIGPLGAFAKQRPIRRCRAGTPRSGCPPRGRPRRHTARGTAGRRPPSSILEESPNPVASSILFWFRGRSRAGRPVGGWPSSSMIADAVDRPPLWQVHGAREGPGAKGSR